MEIRSSSSLSSKLRQLMSLDSPRVVVPNKKDASFFKNEETPEVSMSDEVTSWSPPTPKTVLVVGCCLCTHGQRLFLLSISDPGRHAYLRSLLATTDGDLIFCWICRQAVTRLFHLWEELGDVEIRIRAVVGQRSQQRPSGKVVLSSSSSSFSIELRRLMSLEGPRVVLGQKKCPSSKRKEVPKRCLPVPPRPNVVDKYRMDPPVVTCSLCTHDQGLSTLSISNNTPRETHLQLLPLGIGGDHPDLIFCSVCRHTVTRLFTLREEVEDMEIRIRAVVHQREQKESGLPEDERTLNFSLRHEPEDDDSLPQDSKTVFFCKIKEGRDDGDSAKSEQPNDDAVAETSEGPVDIKPSNYKCRPCHLEFETQKQCRNHMRQVHCGRGKRGKSYKCRPCGKVFQKKVQYMSHMNKEHQRRGDIDSVPPVTSYQGKGGVTFYRCPKCQKGFPKYAYVFDHLRKNHGLLVSRKKFCSVCKKGFRSPELFNAHSHPDKGDPTNVVYTCDVCYKVFERENYLTTHKNQVHVNKDRGACPHCGKTFKKKQALERHRMTCSLPEAEQRTCGHCSKVFANVPERLDHEDVVHKGKSSNKCFFCGKTCSSLGSLSNHLRIHTLEHPYQCDKCGQHFANDNNVKRHMATVCGTEETREKIKKQCRKKTMKKRDQRLAGRPQIASSSKFHECPDCGKKCTHKITLFNHQVRFHGRQPPKNKKTCPVCSEHFWRDDLFEAHTHPDSSKASFFKCSDCGNHLSTPALFRRHNYEVHGKKFLMDCPHCGRVFPTKESFKSHGSSRCSGRDREQCHCGKVFVTRAERHDHDRVVHKGLTSLKCYFCSKVLMTEISLFKHLKLHTLERHHICHKCGKRFGHEYIFKDHRCKKQSLPSDPATSSSKVEKKKVHKCPECGQIFPQWIAVSNHLKKVHGLNLSKKKFCPECKTAFLSTELFEAHIHPDKKDPRKVAYKCSLCEKLLSTPALLRRHKHEIHERKFQVACPNCGKVCSRPEQLEVHIRICCADQKKCHYCGKMFENGDERYDHERVVHKGLKSYKCYFCPKIMSSSTSLDAHLRTHTLERPFVCSKCGDDFPGSGGLRNHLILVHGTDKKKREEIRRRCREFSVKYRASLPYRCGQCDMGFPRKVYLTRHEDEEH